MNGSVALAAILISAPVGLFLLHALVSRIVRYCGYRSAAPQIVAACTAGLGNVPVVYLAWEMALKNVAANPLEVICGLAYVLLTYNACCFGYLCFLNLSETSLHVNILMRLLVGGGMPPEELARIYGVEEMIGARIDRMVAMGQLTQQEDRYFLGNRTLVLVGRVLNTCRRILGLPLSPE
jgi:hypothetical protein